MEYCLYMFDRSPLTQMIRSGWPIPDCRCRPRRVWHAIRPVWGAPCTGAQAQPMSQLDRTRGLMARRQERGRMAGWLCGWWRSRAPVSPRLPLALARPALLSVPRPPLSLPCRQPAGGAVPWWQSAEWSGEHDQMPCPATASLHGASASAPHPSRVAVTNSSRVTSRGFR